MADFLNMKVVVASGEQTPAERFAGLTKDPKTFYKVADDLYFGDKKLTNGADLAVAVQNIATNAGDIVTINQEIAKLEGSSTVNGSIRYIVEGYLDALDADDIPVTDAAGHFTSDNVEDVLAELFGLIGEGGEAGVVTCEQPTTTAMAHVYSFYQGLTGSETPAEKEAKKIVDVNIPKDMVVSAGEVKVVDTADEPYEGAEVGDKYIDLTISNAAQDHIYIPVKDLVDIYTGGTTAEVTVTVSNTNEISATIGKISGSKVVFQEADAEQGISEITVNQKLNSLDSLKADKTQLVSTAISHTAASGVTTVSAELLQQESDIEDLTDLIGEIPAGSTAETIIEYISEVSSGNVDDLDSSITAETGKVVSGFDIVAGKIVQTSISKIELTADNISYDSSTVACALADLSSDLSNLDDKVGEIPGTSTATSVIEYIDEQFASVDMSASHITVADTNNYYTTPQSGDKNVELILAEIGSHLTWQEV